MGDELLRIVGTARWGPPPSADISGGPMTWWERVMAHIGQSLTDIGVYLESRASARVRAIARAKYEAAFGKPVNYSYHITYVSAAGETVGAPEIDAPEVVP